MKKILEKKYCLAVILMIAVILRLIPTLGAIREDSRMLRPDSSGYLDPAMALAEYGEYPTTRRPPGYPLLAAAVYFSGGSNRVLAVIQIGISVAACWLTFLAAAEYGGKACGNTAALLSACNLTAIANTPLLLSDTWFSLFAAAQFWLFIRYWKRRTIRDLMFACAIAAAATLIRPINQLIIIPILFFIAFMPELSWRKKMFHGACGLFLFIALTTPWMYRNYRAGATFAIDTNTGAMRHQNGAMLMAEVNDSDFESEKEKLLAAEAAEFADAEKYPDERSRENWRIKEFRRMVMKHPVRYFCQHFDYRVLLPDAPTFLEDFGLTNSDRGTMGVLKKDGLFAAVRHYFGEQWLLLITLLIPLLLPTGIMYLAIICRLWQNIRHIKKSFREILIFLIFAEYYLFLPGAITAPRYQLPALPCLCMLAAMTILPWITRKNAETIRTPEEMDSKA